MSEHGDIQPSDARDPQGGRRPHALLIVAHGSPSDPEPQERFINRLAARVGARCGLPVQGATLAKPGALERALSGLGAPHVFPHFMSDGWFVSTNLQKRLAAAGAGEWTTMTPLGMRPALVRVAQRRLRKTLSQYGWIAPETTLVIAAHGSPKDPRPAAATERFAERLGADGDFADIRLGYVDEAPALADAARVAGPAVVLPFFAARAGHVLMDLPEALETARFTGPVLPPIGAWDDIPLLIANAVQTGSD